MTQIVNLPTPAPAPAVAPGQPAPPPPEPLIFTDTRGRPSSETEQAISMAADLVKHGADPERVKKAMAADGYTFAPDNRSKREVAFDDAFGPPRAADGYKIGWTGRLPADADPIAAQELDTAARTWLHAMQFPSEVGNSLAEMVFDAARANADRTPQQRQEWKAEQDSILLKFARGDAGAADEAREVANRVLEYAPAEITKAFREAGALDDAAVIVQLSLQGRRMAHRIGLRS